jgi:hypothetical protein
MINRFEELDWKASQMFKQDYLEKRKHSIARKDSSKID